MPIKMKLTADLAQKIDELKNELRDFVDEQRDEHCDKSDKWQEGEKGQAHYEWLRELENVCDDLGTMPQEVE